MNRRGRRLVEKAAVVGGLKAGTFVSWQSSNGKSTSKGRVVSIHNGKVPGVIAAATGAPEAPAARVQLYAKSGDGWEATSVHVAHDAAALTSIGALAEPSPVSKALEAVAGSFDDITNQVQDAIGDRIEQIAGVECDVWVCDIGFDWAVYRVNYDGDLMMVTYTIDANGITLSDPVEVFKVTTYVPDTSDAGESEPTAPVQGGSTSTSSPTMGGPDGTGVHDGVFETTVTDSAVRSLESIETVRHEGRLLASLGSDASGGRVFEVQIIAYGDSKNGRRYPEGVMRQAAALYNGAKAYDHHRTDAELNTGTTVGIIGDYRNVEATATGLKGELHLLPSATHTAELLDRTLANQAEGLPPLVGISHDVMTTWKPLTINGRQGREVTAITGVNSADVVADPAAGGMAQRMVANTGGITPPNKEIIVTLKQLLDLLRAAESAKRPALLTEHAHLIESFGFTVADFAREVESVHVAPVGSPALTPTVPAPVRETESAGYVKGSAMADVIVERAVKRAKLDDRFAESVSADLGAKFTDADLAAAIASATRHAEAAGLVAGGPVVPDVQVVADSHDKKLKALDAFFAQDWSNGYRSLKEAFVDITGHKARFLDTDDLARTILRESAGTMSDGFYSSSRSTESVTSSTWSSILGDSVTRRMVMEYQRPDFQTWRAIVNTFPVNDFRTQRVDRLGDYALLPTVNQGAPYNPLVSPGNEEATYAATKRGGTEDLTLETIANDDVRVIVRIPQRLAIAAAETLYKFVFDFLIAPITATYDATATFAAGHGNTDTNALSDTNLATGRVKMLKQSALNGQANFLPVRPRYLVAPPDLWQLANVLTQSPVAVPSGIAAASNVPNLNRDLETIIVPYFTATSTTAWFLVADPSITPGLEIGFYQGKDTPDLFVQSDQTVGSMFDADKLTYKIRHIYGGTVVDHRGLYRGNT